MTTQDKLTRAIYDTNLPRVRGALFEGITPTIADVLIAYFRFPIVVSILEDNSGIRLEGYMATNATLNLVYQGASYEMLKTVANSFATLFL